ncbi:MAG: LysR family transcriptional regulator [Actinomycetota bacterium]|nr:LysR family transcriptional regulator [Actinomycetota bacterium]
MLDVRRLRVLLEVVDAGSVTAAAASLGYTPSAISQSLAALEREAKIPLFEKAGRGIRPTEAALLLAEHARALDRQLRDAEEAVEALRAGQAGRLRLVAFATAGAALVPNALARFRADHAGMGFDLAIAETDEALAQLRSGRTDIGVIAVDSSAETKGEDLSFSHLLEDPYRLVLPRAHPLANHEGVSLRDLSAERWIATASARCNCLETVNRACARAGFTPRFDIEADEFATTVGFVGAGLGVSMVPALALSAVPETVAVCRIRGQEPSRHVYAVARTGVSDFPAIRAMVDVLRASAESSLAAAA